MTLYNGVTGRSVVLATPLETRRLRPTYVLQKEAYWEHKYHRRKQQTFLLFPETT